MFTMVFLNPLSPLFHDTENLYRTEGSMGRTILEVGEVSSLHLNMLGIISDRIIHQLQPADQDIHFLPASVHVQCSLHSGR